MILLVVLAALFLPAGVPGSEAAAAGARPSGQAAYGLHCSSCHGMEAQGTPQGPPLRGAGAAALDFMLSTGRMPMADPSRPMLRQPPRLTPGEIQAVIAYVTSLAPGGTPVPHVTPERGDLARGGRVFAANCAACHGAAAQGAAEGQGQVAPSLREATPVQIAEAVRIGPGPMPPFGEHTLSQADLESLVRYVIALRTLPDRGGIGLGHEGPVIEGFVAWVFGLGILVIVIRLIGTTT